MLKRNLLRVLDRDVWTWVNRLAPRVFLGLLFRARFHSAPFGQDRTPVWIEPGNAAQFVKRLFELDPYPDPTHYSWIASRGWTCTSTLA